MPNPANLLTLLNTADRIAAAQQRAYVQLVAAHERDDHPAMTRWINTLHRLNRLALRNAERITHQFDSAA